VARIEVPMPQMGESIAEGTVSRWLKQLGEYVERDQPILEISTDKVDAEIPAPQSGTLVEVVVAEGQTVEVGTVVAYIDTEGSPSAAAPAAPAPAAAPAATPAPVASAPEAPAVAASTDSADERLRQKSTPVVRRMAEEHGVDLARVSGSGQAGRVTKQDLLDFLETGPAATAVAPAAPATAVAPAASASAPVPAPAAPTTAPSDFWKTFYAQVQHPEFPVREGDRVETMDKIRRLTAEHMVVAKRVAPHVHSSIEIDFTRVDQLRKILKGSWDAQGVKVSYTAFVIWAVARVLRQFPNINAAASGNNIIYRGNVNVGMAVDLDPGLIVPVIRDADHLSLVGIARQVGDLAERARSRKLGPQEIQGATFSLTNPGVLGTLMGTPVIPKGTAGILGTGSIDKRVVVLTDPTTGQDVMAIRKRSIFTLGYDHRIVDGADAARFLARIKATMEGFPEDA
jgi:pyruvate dehydrogenase E2 component (dihydrolipoamide acetyltransferase)